MASVAISATRPRPPGRSDPAREDRPRHALRLPAPGRGEPACPVPLRQPPGARPRRPDPDLEPRPAAGVRGRRHPDREGLLDAGERLRRDRDGFAALPLPGRRGPRSRAVRPPPLPRAVRTVPLARLAPPVDEREHRDVPRLRRLLASVPARLPGP